MNIFKSTLAVLGMTFALAACEPVPGNPNAPGAVSSVEFTQMNQIFEEYTPLSFKAMHISEMRKRLRDGGYQRASTRRNKNGATTELWRSVIKRGDTNVASTRVRMTTCENSGIVGHSRTTIDDMHASFAKEVVAYIRARKSLILIDERNGEGNGRKRYILISADNPTARRGDIPYGQIASGLGGVRIFDNGQRRVGITIFTNCKSK